MSFSYAVVCRGRLVLAEFPSTGGQMEAAVVKIVGQVDTRNPRLSAEHGSVIFTTLTEPNGITYLCKCDKAVEPTVRTNFVNELQREWMVQFGANGASFGQLEKNAEFAPVIERLINTYNSERARKLHEVRTNIGEAQAEMTRNVERAMVRGATINEMEDQANDIAETANAYRRDARALRLRMCRRRCIVVVVILALLALFVTLAVVVKKAGKAH